jgi:hypothetical protein
VRLKNQDSMKMYPLGNFGQALRASEHAGLQRQSFEQLVRNAPNVFEIRIGSWQGGLEDVDGLLDIRLCHHLDSGLRIPAVCPNPDKPPEAHGKPYLA